MIKYQCKLSNGIKKQVCNVISDKTLKKGDLITIDNSDSFPLYKKRFWKIEEIYHIGSYQECYMTFD